MSKFVADLHLHSSYARATSRNLNFDTLVEWAKLKGVNLLSSADFTHPIWWQETKKVLRESSSLGFYEYGGVSFVLGTEISCIYTQGGSQRRIHCLLFFPEKNNVDKFNTNLSQKANLQSDGRPILGLSAKQLLELALSVNEKAIFIPAHVWTPWFSLYGSNSGFDSIEECFGDLAKYVYAVETGLSSDPEMNWRIKELDTKSIVSFSDLHSVQKMGREATVFDTEFNYDGLLAALKSAQITDQSIFSVSNSREISRLELTQHKSSLGIVKSKKTNPQPVSGKIALTVEFFPEEGKYHYTGHRNCKVRHSPDQSDRLGFICPKCKRKLTVGVMHRVEELADKNRSEGYKPENRPPFKRLVPLLEILTEVFGVQTASQKVLNEYYRLVKTFGSELAILLKVSLEDIEKEVSVFKIVESIKRVRQGNILVDPGYDGVYGTVKIWPDQVNSNKKQGMPIQKVADGQTRLFD